MAKTLIERFGFNDPDRKTPFHDLICLWVHENSKQVMHKVFGDTASDPDVKAACRDINLMLAALGSKSEARVAGEKYEQNWELPIGARSTAGFVDIAVRRTAVIETGLESTIVIDGCGRGWLKFEDALSNGYKIDELNWDGFHEVYQRFSALKDAGILPLRRRYPALYPAHEVTGEKLFVEVKSKVTSIGDLLRQIQFYRTFVKDTPWCVVSPDTRYAEIIRQQGIHFVECPRHVVSQNGQLDLF